MAAPEHERGPVERAQRRGEPLAGGGDVGQGAVEREHRATRVAVEVVVHAVDEGRGSPRGLPRRSSEAEAEAGGGGHEQLAGVRRAPQPRERVPAIAGQRAGAEQDRAGEPVGLAGCPSAGPTARRSRARRGARARSPARRARGRRTRACAATVCGTRPARRPGQIRGRPRPPRASGGRWRRAAAPSPRSSPGCRAGTRRPRLRPAAGLAQRGAYSADTQVARRTFDLRVPAKRARAARDADGDRGAQHVGWTSRMPTTATRAPATEGVVLGRRAQSACASTPRARAVPGRARPAPPAAGRHGGCGVAAATWRSRAPCARPGRRSRPRPSSSCRQPGLERGLGTLLRYPAAAGVLWPAEQPRIWPSRSQVEVGGPVSPSSSAARLGIDARTSISRPWAWRDRQAPDRFAQRRHAARTLQAIAGTRSLWRHAHVSKLLSEDRPALRVLAAARQPAFRGRSSTACTSELSTAKPVAPCSSSTAPSRRTWSAQACASTRPAVRPLQFIINAQRQRAAFPSAEIRVLERSGHWPLVDDPHRSP